MSRVDQERVTVTVDGEDFGVWDAFSGGAAKADDTKNRPGGMGPEESLGGPISRETFTVARNYKLERDLPQEKRLNAKVGSGRVVATRQMLNRDRSTAGEPIVYTGTLMGYIPADHDSNSGDKKTVSLEVSADEPVS